MTGSSQNGCVHLIRCTIAAYVQLAVKEYRLHCMLFKRMATCYNAKQARGVAFLVQ